MSQAREENVAAIAGTKRSVCHVWLLLVVVATHLVAGGGRRSFVRVRAGALVGRPRCGGFPAVGVEGSGFGRVEGHVFFFFQAEDGIRDSSVTGVQTCALPICTCLPGGATPSTAATRASLTSTWLFPASRTPASRLPANTCSPASCSTRPTS